MGAQRWEVPFGEPLQPFAGGSDQWEGIRVHYDGRI